MGCVASYSILGPGVQILVHPANPLKDMTEKMGKGL